MTSEVSRNLSHPYFDVFWVLLYILYCSTFKVVQKYNEYM